MFITDFLDASITAIRYLDQDRINRMVSALVAVKTSGRLFIIGNGGGAAHASHAVCDFRNLAGIEAYSFDNVAELTANVNDCDWGTAYLKWLVRNEVNKSDTLLVLSVGGGSEERDISRNLIFCIRHAKTMSCPVLSVVGPNGGYAVERSDVCVVIPALGKWVTPITESIQSLVLHLLVTHPDLAVGKPTWESTQ